MAVLEPPSVPTSTKKSQEPQELLYESALEDSQSANGLRVSEAEYWETYYHEDDVLYEWNNGILEEKPMGDYLSFTVYSWFFSLLKEYLRAHPIALMIGLEIGFRLDLRHKVSIRRPDLAVVLQSNPTPIVSEDRTYRGIFDLCIEFLSDSKPQDVQRDTVVKKHEYEQAGVQEYFILDRKGQETAFYRQHSSGQYRPIPQPDGIVQSTVLPGFQFRIADLYEQPDFRERLDDSVYQSYLLLDYQAERQRAERLAARLKELGADPEETQ